MKPGDRVETPDGRGRVLSVWTERRWIARRSFPVGFALVELDGGSQRVYPARDFRPTEPAEETAERRTA